MNATIQEQLDTIIVWLRELDARLSAIEALHPPGE
jgi:hypothetical protein